MMKRLSGDAKGRCDTARNVSALRAEHFPATDLFLRTKAEPRCEGGGISKASYISANFAENRLCRYGANSRHVCQIDAEYPVEFASQIEIFWVRSLVVGSDKPSYVAADSGMLLRQWLAHPTAA
jgi:hypothetical protein